MLFKYKMKILILVQRMEHMDILIELLSKNNEDANIIGVRGSSMGRSYDFKVNSVVEFPVSYDSIFSRFRNGEFDIVIASGIADEGVDINSIDCLLICSGQKSFIKTTQRAGRGLRKKSGLNEVYILDFMDNSHPYLKKHSILRHDHYNSVGAIELTPQKFIDRVYQNFLTRNSENEDEKS